MGSGVGTMGRKRNQPKRMVITSQQLFDMQKPKHDGFLCGHGVHGASKYDRNKAKRDMRRELGI